MPTMKFRIGASVDRSVEAVFGNIEQRAKRAGTVVERSLNPTMKAGNGRGGPYRTAAKEAERSYQKINHAAEQSSRKQIRETERVRREMERGYKQLARVAETETRRQYQSEMRARDAFARRTSYQSLRNMGQLGRIGVRAAGGIARGMGIDTSLQGGMRRGVEINSAAVGIANQERIATGQSRGAAYYEQSARQIAGGLSIDPSKVMAGMRAFTGMTGEFGASNKMIGGLARISAASGADLGQMGSAAGAVYNQTHDIQSTLAVVRSLAVQSAKGSIEMKDYATKIGKLAAPAANFAGGTSKNIEILSAMAQHAAPYAGGPAQAATAVRAFATTFGKKSSLAAFKKSGIDVFTDKSQTQMRGPLELLHDVLLKTGGSLPKMAQLFPNARALMPLMQPLAATFNKAGGGEAGAQAAIDDITKVMKGQLDKGTEAKNVAAYRQSQAAKAQEFQNNLDKVVSVMAKDLMPAMEQLEPTIIKSIKAFGTLVTFLSDHVGLAIVGAIVGSVGKAALGAALRSSIDRAMSGFGGGGSGGPGIAGARVATGRSGGFLSRPSRSGMIGAAGTGLAIGIPVAAAIYSSGTSDWESTSKGMAGLTKGLAGQHGSGLGSALVEAQNALRKQKDQYYGGITGGLWGDFKDLTGMGNQAEFKGAEDLIARKKAEYAQFTKTGKLPPGVTAAEMKGGGGAAEVKLSSSSAASFGRASADALTGSTLQVHVTNMPAEGPAADRGNAAPIPP